MKSMNYSKIISNLSIVLILTFFIPLKIFAVGTFRFALLTDLHINLNSPTSVIDLQNSVTQINNTDSIDFILVTGDISDDGSTKALEKAKEILDQLQKPYYIIMGNHETKWSESGVTVFKRIFGYERFEFEHKGYLFLGFNTGPIIRMALGHVASEDIDWLKQELKEKDIDGKPVFLITHYPLTPQDVDNWYDVTDVVRPYSIKAFIGGHYHVNRYLNYDGIPGIVNRSNLRGAKSVGGYSEYDVTNDSLFVYEHLIGKPKDKWLAISLKKKYYSKTPDSYSMRPSFDINKQYLGIFEKWLIDSRVGIYCSPVIYNEYLYTGDNSGCLNCYNKNNGQKQWSFRSGSRIIGMPAISHGIVVFGSTDCNIYGIDAKTGKELWHLETKAPVFGAVRVLKGIAYIGASDHIFRAINVKTGKVIWEYKKVKGYVETLPFITKHKVIFGAWDNTLYALNQKDGKELWTWNSGKKGMHYSPAAVWPVAAYGKVFITDPQRAITAIDLKTGRTIWRTFESKVRETIGLSKDKKRIFSNTMQDSIVCYSVSSNFPSEIWASNIRYGYEYAPSMPREKEGIVFGSNKDGLLFAVDGKTGRLIWKHKTGNTLINTIVPVSKEKIYFTNTNGVICELNIDKQIYKK